MPSYTSSSSAARGHISPDAYVSQEQRQQQQQQQANEWSYGMAIDSSMRDTAGFDDSPLRETFGRAYTNKYDTSTAEYRKSPYQRSRSRTVKYDAWKAAKQQQEQQQPSTPPPFYTRRGASRSMFDADIDFQASYLQLVCQVHIVEVCFCYSAHFADTAVSVRI
jgi:hypothetical protein